MSDLGFGSPTGGDPPYDWGFGSPTPSDFDGTEGVDSGWGSPSALVAAAVRDGVVVYGHEGGDLVQILAEWPSAGPFRLRLQAVDGTLYPSATGWAYSGRAGQGPDVYPEAAGSMLSFRLPRVPPGLYTLRVHWGSGFGLSADVTQRIRVVYSARHMADWRMRANMHRLYRAAGPRSPGADKPLVMPEGG